MKKTNYSISTISSHPRRLVLAALTLAISAGLWAGSAQAALVARIDGTYPVGGVASQTPGSYQTYTFQSTATSSTTLLSIMFRNDPAYTSMDNVALVLGVSGNLLLNGGFHTNVGGGKIPDNWLAVGTQGLPAAGTWLAGGGNGYWYDGAVGGFDGIAQYVATTPGETYTISFDLRANQFNSTNVVTEVYFGELPPGVVVTGGGSGAQIPEPTSLLVMGLTTGGLLLRRRRLSSVAGSGAVA